MKQIGLLGIAVVLALGCGKPKKQCEWVLPPNVFFFIVHQDGQPLPDSINAALKMYYIDGEEKIYRPPPNIDDSTFVFQAGRFSGNLSNSKVLANPYIDMPKTWYLEFPDGEVDTVKRSKRRVVRRSFCSISKLKWGVS